MSESTGSAEDTPPTTPSLALIPASPTKEDDGMPTLITATESVQINPPPDSMPPPSRPATSSLSPGTAHLSRPKNPLPEESSSENAFPSLNGPQRISGPGPSRKKVVLEPGHSPMDWAKLKSSLSSPRLLKIPPSELILHNKREDLWMAINGKIYNATPYLKFHPGGPTQLMRGAGKDATALFNSVHPWVNVEFMLDACCVGILVSEPVRT